MKHVLPALVAVVCALAACETTADHRALYSPDKPRGPYTDMLRGSTLAGRYNHQSQSFEVTAAGPQPPAESGPIAPPPPPPLTPSGAPETNSGAPAPTPLPETTIPGAQSGASSSVIPGTSAPVTTPTTGSEPTAVAPPPGPTVPAPGPAAVPAPGAPPAGSETPAPIPGLSQ